MEGARARPSEAGTGNVPEVQEVQEGPDGALENAVALHRTSLAADNAESSNTCVPPTGQVGQIGTGIAWSLHGMPPEGGSPSLPCPPAARWAQDGLCHDVALEPGKGDLT